MQVAIRIQLRRDTAANWVSANPVLRAGEIGIETDTLKFKIGNGSTWTATTNYANVTPSGLTTSLGDYILVADQGTPGGPAELDSNGDLIIPENSIVLWNDDAHTYTTTLTATQPTANRTITIPNNSGTIALTSDISTAVSNLVDGAPGLLDTLNELAAAVNDDPTFFTTVATNLTNHEADTTNIHGIADTSKLLTTDGTQTVTNKTLNSPKINEDVPLTVSSTELNILDGATLSTTELNYVDGVTSSIQTQLNSKASSTDLSTHESDTTNIHGIADTAELATKAFAAELLTNATKSNISITGDKNGLTITAENGVADSTTDALAEGGTNKYFTDDRAQDAVAAALAAGTHTNILVSYNDVENAISLTGAVTYTDENAQDAVGNAVGTGLSYNDTTGAISVTPNTYDAYGAASTAQTNAIAHADALTTSDVAEGTALYFTDERAQDAVGNSVGNGLDYDDATGAISVDPSEFALNSIGAPSAAVSLNSQKITGLAAPTDASDATNKAYVDGLAAGINFHQPVIAATSGNLAGTYNNGTSGVGATLTKETNGSIGTIDGAAVAVGNRILLRAQTDAKQNGIYVITALGDGSNPWVITRAADSDNNPAGELANGDFCFVTGGTTNGSKGFLVSTTGTITIGTTEIQYAQFNASEAILAGNGISKSGATISIDTAITVDKNTTQTLTNKTLTSPIINTPTGITKSDVGLANVDNTSDTSKPISTATQSALDLKAALASPTFTGTVILPNNTVTNAMLAGSIANNKLTNSSIIMSIGTSDTTVALGSTYQIPSATPDLPGLVYGLVDSFNDNTGVGEFVLGSLTSGANNSAFGLDALSSVQDGSNNVAIGSAAAGQLLSGSQNVALGTSAGATITTGSNNIVIGYNAATTAVNTSNQIVLGNNSITSFRIPGLGLDVNASNKIVTETNTTTLTNKTLNNVIVNGVNFGNTPISVAAPIDDEHAVNKAYLANQIASSVGSDIFPLDDISVFFDGSTSRFQLTYDGDVFIPQNPYKLLITINGILQILGNQEKHWLSLIPSDGYFFDNDGFVQFGEPVPVGSKFEARYMSGPESQTAKKSIYPFRAVDIQLGD
jgi:hypothetical protein